jgi:hypothetical protein
MFRLRPSPCRAAKAQPCPKSRPKRPPRLRRPLVSSRASPLPLLSSPPPFHLFSPAAQRTVVILAMPWCRRPTSSQPTTSRPTSPTCRPPWASFPAPRSGCPTVMDRPPLQRLAGCLVFPAGWEAQAVRRLHRRRPRGQLSPSRPRVISPW